MRVCMYASVCKSVMARADSVLLRRVLASSTAHSPSRDAGLAQRNATTPWQGASTTVDGSGELGCEHLPRVRESSCPSSTGCVPEAWLNRRKAESAKRDRMVPTLLHSNNQYIKQNGVINFYRATKALMASFNIY